MLVAGLLLVGHVAAEDGLFAAAGATLSRLPGGRVALYAMLLALVVGVTAVLNLDTSALFLTPVLVHAARSRGVEEHAFLYGAVFMSNAVFGGLIVRRSELPLIHSGGVIPNISRRVGATTRSEIFSGLSR